MSAIWTVVTMAGAALAFSLFAAPPAHAAGDDFYIGYSSRGDLTLTYVTGRDHHRYRGRHHRHRYGYDRHYRPYAHRHTHRSYRSRPYYSTPRYRYRHGHSSKHRYGHGYGHGYGYDHHHDYGRHRGYRAPVRHSGHGCWRENRRGHFRGDPAVVSVRLCRDGYGGHYVVSGSKRLVRWIY